LNKYAKLAMHHWATTDPARYATIENPQAFFRELGEQAEAQIQELAARLAGPDQPGEEYLQKVGRLNMARLQAEEAVLSDLIWIAEPAAAETTTPTDRVTQTMRDVHRSLFEEDDEQA
jgi:hypothetical protein